MSPSDRPAGRAALARVDALLYRAPCAPVRTSFGVMHERPALLVRVEDADGARGWGEIWCNFPPCGAEHRAALLRTVVAPVALAAGLDPDDPPGCSAVLARRFAVLALQSGEPGPIAQVLAGVDQALWDLKARRAGLPLWRLLGADTPRVPAYASGIGPEAAVETALAQQAGGHRAFKLKVGFDLAADVARLGRMREALGSEARLMVDANQAWSPHDAVGACARLAALGPLWIEEPMPVDAPAADWRALAAGLPPSVVLAGGENLIGDAAFDAAIATGALRVLQPDVAKWGGISGCLAVARRARAAGLRYCPHFLGAGVGLAMSAHLLAAAGGDGWLEMDCNPNPLRDLLAGGLSPVRDGHVTLSDAPGYGEPPDAAALRAYERAA